MRALERPPRHSRSATGWACVVATNLAVDAHRRPARSPTVTISVERGSRGSDPSESVGLRDAVRTGLEALPVEFRATVVLRFYADFTVPEIAAAMNVPEGTVKSRLHRAISELRRHLPLEAMT